MKKTFLAKRNALLSSARFSSGTIALLVAIVALLLRLLAPNIFWYITAPVFRVSDSIATGSHYVLSGFNDAAALTVKNDALTNQNSALANENRALQAKIADLSALPGTSAGAGIPASVLVRPPQSPYDIFVLSAGTHVGVEQGMEALGPGGVPLGRITSVTEDFSQLTLFSAPGVSTLGWVGSSHTPITILGVGGGALSAVAPRSANITEGEMVYVPGPGELSLGTVVRVDSDPSSPSLTLRIVPALNLYSVTWVELRATPLGTFTSIPSASSTPL